ncbi:methyltransferase domain-containing protein [Acidaminobacter sp. JC074]|uniref:class I SAM-dependent methyltransferase n=1 Tax=Acidaminobacter sp. JC074 TaxID=2530199 RepID=UPI001F0D3EDA|nr:class I SAM-dependent methyltransferase [Acidaminobacter sp. JC074]MCH4889063.1 methyltransferase domain-containing protein [Acidaminobacter sp. JC074]
MKRKEMIELLKQVKPYDKGTHTMWTDPYIGKHLLSAHLDQSNDAASRNKKSIIKTIGWMESMMKKSSSILDLGCGPGLYTSEFSKRGYQVTGVDFSRNSINYANKDAIDKGLRIDYKCMNYLELNYDNQFDMIMMIYCDFGVLSNEDRQGLIDNIIKALKPGGIFIFDALNEAAIRKMRFEKSWDVSEGGFWQPGPYTSLSERIHFEEIRAILDQHVIIEANNNFKLYRFWNHYFSLEDVKAMFNKYTENITQHDNIIEDDVTFYVIKK